MKELLEKHRILFYLSFKRNPTKKENFCFRKGVEAGINKIHTDLHKSIDKVVKTK